MKVTDEKLVQLDTLLSDDNNPRIHNRKNIDAIKRSIERFGQYRPFVVNQRDHRVAVGNGMLEAMREMGYAEGLAVFVDLNDEDFRLLSIADNRSCDMSREDPALLLNRLTSISEELQNVAGFSGADIEIVKYESDGELDKPYVPKVKEDNDEIFDFAFSVIHFPVFRPVYDRWVKKHGFDDMDNDEAENRIKSMLGVNNE